MSDNIDYDEVNKAFVNLGDTAAWCLQVASTLKKFTAEQREITGILQGLYDVHGCPPSAGRPAPD